MVGTTAIVRSGYAGTSTSIVFGQLLLLYEIPSSSPRIRLRGYAAAESAVGDCLEMNWKGAATHCLGMHKPLRGRSGVGRRRAAELFRCTKPSTGPQTSSKSEGPQRHNNEESNKGHAGKRRGGAGVDAGLRGQQAARVHRVRQKRANRQGSDV